MSTAGFIIPTADQFDFRATVLSHGWLMLPPFRWDEDSGTLSYLLQAASGELQRLQMSEGGVGHSTGSARLSSGSTRR